MLAFIGRDLKCFGDGLDSVEDMSDGWLQAYAAGGDQANGVLQVRLGADIGEEIAQAAFAKEVDIELQRAAEPGDADDLASGADGINGLQKSPVAGESLFGAASGAF